MMIHTLFRRWRVEPLAVVEAESPGRAVELASRAGVPLDYADLSGWEAPRCFLPGVNLQGADLTGALLSGAYLRKADLRKADLANAILSSASLREADLRNADLRNVDFRNADLRGARFPGANLAGALLTGAKLDGVVADWTRAAFAVELLRRDPQCQDEALTLTLELAMEADDRPYAWLRTVVRRPQLSGWVGRVLAPALTPGDRVPDALRILTTPASSSTSRNPDAPKGRCFHWTRCARSTRDVVRKNA